MRHTPAGSPAAASAAPPPARREVPGGRNSENEATVTMREGKGYVVRTPDGVWIEGKP
ncbi:hypothetical protein [Cupriavidus consociatus]|uniref:hypothetical protein n=1 Tax=Cupriavidus consociatus TaxID=2821357 RepID=UPI001AE489A1|nr:MULTISPECIES: hypothetical protein [unclassified Cupriavidus]MBP0621518.1 hypothetical protein [Cupriavidus sp. LEh25]MDK2658191.1 hypothetical protein [Cupriavidus sp. LEh21]